MFTEYTAPVAHSMLRMLQQPSIQPHEPIQEYCLYWMAFNNIYTTLSDQHRKGNGKGFKKNRDGTIKTIIDGDVIIRAVKIRQEQEQLQIAFAAFSDELKTQLITDGNTEFFVYRSPQYQGRQIVFDKQTPPQRLNGVLNVGKTIDTDFPYWAPICVKSYESYMKGLQDDKTQNLLANQILSLLYTVRNNTFHGGKRFDDANDTEVLRKATPLLAIIVRSFLTIGY